MRRGEVYEAELPGGRRPAVIVTRDVAIPMLANVCVAEVTRTIRGLPTEVLVGRVHGLPSESAVNCDNLFTLRKSRVGPRRGSLGPEELRRLNDALRIALELD